MSQLAEVRTLADLIAEAQMLSAVLYGDEENKGFIDEFRDATDQLRAQHAKLSDLAGNVFSSTAERISEVENSTEYILQSLKRVELTAAKLSLLDDPDRWVEHVKTSMAIRFAEDPLFERVFARMAEAAMTQASGRFFSDLERQMTAVLGDVLAEKGVRLRTTQPPSSKGGDFVQVDKRKWTWLVSSLVVTSTLCVVLAGLSFLRG